MQLSKSRVLLVQFLSVAIIAAGFVQVSWAGSIGTDYLVDSDARSASLARIEALLVRDDVAQQLQSFGVDKASIDVRLAGLTTAELVALEGQIDEQIAGGDAIAVIGVVFLVLLILELVGVTDIFKSI